MPSGTGLEGVGGNTGALADRQALQAIAAADPSLPHREPVTSARAYLAMFEVVVIDVADAVPGFSELMVVVVTAGPPTRQPGCLLGNGPWVMQGT